MLGPSARGEAAALVVGGAVAYTVEAGGASKVPAVRGLTGGLQGRALEALAGEGGVGHARVPVPPGSVVVGNRSSHEERARKCPSVSVRIVGIGLSGRARRHSQPFPTCPTLGF